MNDAHPGWHVEVLDWRALTELPSKMRKPIQLPEGRPQSVCHSFILLGAGTLEVERRYRRAGGSCGDDCVVHRLELAYAASAEHHLSAQRCSRDREGATYP